MWTILALSACSQPPSSSAATTDEDGGVPFNCEEDWDYGNTHQVPSPVGIVRADHVPSDASYEARTGSWTYGDQVGDGDSTTPDIRWDNWFYAVEDDAGVHVVIQNSAGNDVAYHPPEDPEHPMEGDHACEVVVGSGT